MFITHKGQGNGDVKIMEVEGKRDKGEEVTVHYGNVPPKWKTWNDEAFSREWNKTYLN